VTSPEEPTPDPAQPAGEVERVPLKVVPIFVQPIEDEPEAADEEPEADIVEEEAPPRRPRPWLGVIAVLLALGTIGVHIAAVVVASSGEFALGTTLGYVAIGVSALAALVGIVAAVIGRGRITGILAALVAILANPLVLLALLRFLSGLQSA